MVPEIFLREMVQTGMAQEISHKEKDLLEMVQETFPHAMVLGGMFLEIFYSVMSLERCIDETDRGTSLQAGPEISLGEMNLFEMVREIFLGEKSQCEMVQETYCGEMDLETFHEQMNP